VVIRTSPQDSFGIHAKFDFSKNELKKTTRITIFYFYRLFLTNLRKADRRMYHFWMVGAGPWHVRTVPYREQLVQIVPSEAKFFREERIFLRGNKVRTELGSARHIGPSVFRKFARKGRQKIKFRSILVVLFI
jgi:hypothetical protein